jgi:hypothetical protein
LKKKAPHKFWDGKKYLYGAAAQEAYIKSRGGWDKHHFDYAMDVLATRKAIESIELGMNKTPLKRVK